VWRFPQDSPAWLSRWSWGNHREEAAIREGPIPGTRALQRVMWLGRAKSVSGAMSI